MSRIDLPAFQSWLVEHDPVPVVAFDDPVVEAFGHDPRSGYAEAYWLAILGPSALWALRRLNARLDDQPDGFPLPLAPFSREIGLGDGTGRHAPVVRTLARLALFEMVHQLGGQLAVRRSVPPLARRHLSRLPGHLLVAHDEDAALHHERATDGRRCTADLASVQP